jgi:transposase
MFRTNTATGTQFIAGFDLAGTGAGRPAGGQRLRCRCHPRRPCEPGIQAVIPGRSNRRVKIELDRALYKQRNRIERMFGRLKINRAIATRYDQLDETFLSMVHIATARYWLKFVRAA